VVSLQPAVESGEVERPNKHIVFVDDEDEVESFSATEYFDTPKELVGRSYNRLKRDQLLEPVVIAGEDLLRIDEIDDPSTSTREQRRAIRKIKRRQKQAKEELNEREARAQKIQQMIQEKQTQKNLASKSEREQIKTQEGEKPIYKWKPIRQK